MDRHAENVRPTPGEGVGLEGDGNAENVDATLPHPEGDSNPFLAAALSYAARGWRVHPLRPRDKLPTLRRWPERASTDPDTIRRWWAKEPTANIGIATGSGLLVLDVDGDEGRESLNGRHLPPTPTAMTGKGVHYYYQGSGSCKVAFLPGLDIRGDGGYVVAAPSIHPDTGAAYSWADGMSPDDLPLAPAPQWLVGALRPKAAPAPTTPPTTSTPAREASTTTRYGQAALDREAVAVAEASVGERNHRLNTAAFSIGQLVAGGEVLRADAERMLTAAGREAGLEDREVVATVASGLNSGALSPRSAPGTGPDEDGGPVLFKSGDDRLHYTDTGLAHRLVRLYGDDIRYCWQRSQWYCWQGTHWARDEGGLVHALAGELPRRMLRQAVGIDDPDERTAAVQFCIKAEAERARNAAVSLARSVSGVTIKADELDSDRWLLNVRNGTIDLRTGTLRPHDRADLITRMCPVEYHPDAYTSTAGQPVADDQLDTAPAGALWQRFLTDSTGGDQELQKYLACCAGMALTGDTSEELFLFLSGPARSGKSTWIGALMSVLGDYAHAADFSTFILSTNSSPGQHRADILAMDGARLVTAIETSKGSNLDVKLLCMLTGGDVVAARGSYAKHVDNFKPQFTLCLAGNHRPTADDLDSALWERLCEVPFPNSLPKEKRFPAVKRRLTDPADGGAAVLAWAVAGCVDWQRHGLRTPAAVEEAVQDYRQESDPLREFVDECCIIHPQERAPVGDLYAAYRQWCEANGIRRPLDSAVFGRRLTAKGFAVTVQRDGASTLRVRDGIGLIPEDGTTQK